MKNGIIKLIYDTLNINYIEKIYYYPCGEIRKIEIIALKEGYII